jgi:hypothetical protein
MQKYFTLIACLLLLVSCNKKPATTQESVSLESASSIQFVHAATNTIGLRMWFDDVPVQPVGNYYKSNSHYTPIAVGDRKLDIKFAKSNEQLFTLHTNIKKNQKYSLFACDSVGVFKGLLLTDNPLPNNADMAQLRIVNVLSTNEKINATINNGLSHILQLNF